MKFDTTTTNPAQRTNERTNGYPEMRVHNVLAVRWSDRKEKPTELRSIWNTQKKNENVPKRKTETLRYRNSKKKREKRTRT